MIIHFYKIRFFMTALLGMLALSAFGKNDKNILVINTYTDSYIWSNYVFDAIRNEFIGSSAWMGISMESLNMLSVTDEEELIYRRDAILKKSEKDPPEMIVILGNTAFAVFHEELRGRWKDVPTVLCADNSKVVDIYESIHATKISPDKEILLEEWTKGLNVTVVRCPLYIKETIEVMRRLQPGMKRVAFVSDRRYISEQVRNELRKVVDRDFPDLDLLYLTDGDLNLGSLLDTIHTFTPATGILYYSWIQEESQRGKQYLSANNYKIISGANSQTFFTLIDIGIHTGEMGGGYFYCGYDLGRTVVRVLKEISHGSRASEIAWTNAGMPNYYFCYNVLDAAGIPHSLFPKGAIYFFAPESFLSRYRYAIVSIFVLLLILAFLMMRIRFIKKVGLHREKEMLMLEKYKFLFEDMPIPVCKFRLLYDKDGNVIDYVLVEANSIYLNSVMGKKFSIGSKGSSISDDSDKYIKLFKEVLRCKKAYAFTFSEKNADRHFELKVTPAAEKDTIGLFAIEITKLYKAQAMVESINHKLAMALDVANIVPWKWDLSKKTILCDVKRPIELQKEGGDGSEDAFAVPESEYFSKIHKDDRKRVEQAYATLIQGKVEKIREEYRVVTHAGNHTLFEWVEAQATIDQRDENGMPLTLVGSSVVTTQRKMMELDLREAKEKAEESNRLKSAFLANMSHEIRTPLNAIIGFSSILSSTEEVEEKQEYINIIENNNTLLLQLINDILDLSKIEAGSLEFMYTDFNLNEMMNELERMFRLRMEDTQVEVFCTTSLPFCHIRSEKNRLMQVLMNMLTNASKFTEQGSISLGYRLQEDNMLYFYVTDTGCGIPADKKETVFGRFVKLDGFKQGTGLGLSICETIVHKLGGRIGVDSKEGKGSTFWFTIPYTPVAVAPDRSSECELSPSEMEIVTKDKLKILIAEDVMSNYKLFESILKHDYHLIHACNGREAVELFKEQRPHLILMDINMPVLNGYEAVNEIRKISSAVPIIAVTAYAFESDEQRILHSGFNAYTSKPINANALKMKITALLEKRLILI